jgi:hypothetical protein
VECQTEAEMAVTYILKTMATYYYYYYYYYSRVVFKYSSLISINYTFHYY